MKRILMLPFTLAYQAFVLTVFAIKGQPFDKPKATPVPDDPRDVPNTGQVKTLDTDNCVKP